MALKLLGRTQEDGIGSGGLPQGQDQLSLPGFVISRVDSPIDEERVNHTLSKAGIPAGRFNDGDWLRDRQVPIMAQYDCATWTRSRTDLNAAERLLAFADVSFQPIEITVNTQDNEGNPVVFTKKQAIKGSNTKYEFIKNKDTGKIQWFGMHKSFYVRTHWNLSNVIPYIGEIQVAFEEIMAGTPVTYNLLEKFSITSGGTTRI